MHHVAIMNKSWNLIPKIISGEKSIESRWYQTKRTPWDKIKAGDKIFFKNSGEAIIAEAGVSKVMQFEIAGIEDAVRIIKKYGKEICLVNSDPLTWGRLTKYCILIHLKKPRKVEKPFMINKKGFGIGAAWITVGDIEKIKGKVFHIAWLLFLPVFATLIITR